MYGVFPRKPQSFRHQRRPADDCSPGRKEMAQDGGTRGGMFHGEMDRCRESQDWTTACSKASGLVLVRSPYLTIIVTSGANLYAPGVWFADVMPSFFGVILVLVCFVFKSMFSLKPRPFVQSFFVLRYARIPTATRVSSCFSFVFEDVAFPSICSYHYCFIFVWRVRRTFPPSGWCFFLSCDHRLDFRPQLM